MTKNASNYLKAIAIAMMIVHHFWGFPSWVLPKYTKYTYLIGGQDLEATIGLWNRFCVSIFAFITGYAVFINKEYIKLKYRLCKLAEFYLTYWTALAFIYIAGAIAGEPMPNKKQLILDLAGIMNFGPGIHCNFAWYVFFYAEVMLITVPLLQHIFQNGHIVIKFLLSLATMTGITTAFKQTGITGSWAEHFMFWSQVVMTGYIIAKEGTFSRLQEHCLKIFRKHTYILLNAIVLTTCIPAHYYINTEMLNLDFIYAPAFIYSAVNIGRTLKNKLTFIGPTIDAIAANSSNIWFLQALFFTPNKTFQGIAFAPHLGIPIVIWVLLICTGLSLAIKPLQGLVIRTAKMIASNMHKGTRQTK
ncbi:MAG: acyltransferase [Lachnospiraceae bacterium]|nr:acyltransferase [Lachnospiraceae bacterium]